MSNILHWSDLHNDSEDKEIYEQFKSYPFTLWVNENVDYQMLFDITIYMDGSREIEVVGEHVVLFDDNADITETLDCHLPEEQRNKLITMAEDYE